MLFSAAWLHVTSVRLLALVPAVMPSCSGLTCCTHSGLATHPVHSMGSRYLPRPLFTRIDALWCRTIQPALHLSSQSGFSAHRTLPYHLPHGGDPQLR